MSRETLTEKWRSEVRRLEEEYMRDADWEIKENANTNMSYSNFRNWLFEKLIKNKQTLSDYLPPGAVESHFRGDLHIHKLPDSLWIPYCNGWSIKKVLKTGLKTPGVVSRPARHFDTAVAHIVNLFFMGAQEFTGAQAVSAFDLYTAPFIAEDGLSYKRVKQIIQGMLFELNYPARAGYQSPFTNITIFMDTSRDILEGEAIYAGKSKGSLGDYIDEALMIDKALFELYLEGDAYGQPFTFPIPTLMLTKNFDWNGRRWGELSDLIFQALARKGTAYLLNGYASNVEALYAMCLHPSELILYRDENGVHLSTIGELFESHVGESLDDGWFTVRGDVYIVSLNPNTYKLEWKKVKSFYKQSSQRMVVVRTRDGREVRVTPTHPFVVYTPEGFRIKFAKDLREGDLLPVVKKSRIFEDNKRVVLDGLGEVDGDLAFFVGLFVSDGKYLTLSEKDSKRYRADKLVNGRYYKGLQFTLNSSEKELVEWLKSFMETRYGVSVRVKYDKRWPSTVYVLVYSHVLATALARNGVAGRSEEKRVPWFILNSPTDVIKRFIDGIFAGDGYRKRNELHIYNARLAAEIALLLNLIGSPATVRYHNKNQTVRKARTSKTAGRQFHDMLFDRIPWYMARRHRGIVYHRGLYGITTLVRHDAMTSAAERLVASDIALIAVEKIEDVELSEAIEFIDVELEANHLFMHSLGTVSHNCCRLTIDVNHIMSKGNGGLGTNVFQLKISNKTEEDALENFLKSREKGSSYGIWALPDATGSIGVVTLNMPRLAALSGGDWGRFEELLQDQLKKARGVLLTWRKRYRKTLKAGLMPMTKIYLGHFNHHFNTFGVIGLPEAAANFMSNPQLWFEGSHKDMSKAIDIEKKMVHMIREYAEMYEDEDGYLYNVEEIPGESTGYRLARLDMEMFKEEYRRGEIFIPSDGTAPFYSNSIVPYYADVPIYQRAIWEGEVQQEFTGGVMMHLFLNESPDPKALRNMIRRIVENTKVVYFSITPTLSVCRKCGWSAVGTFWECPNCGAKTEVWSRIVGYYRPVNNWNIGKKAEFKLRVHYGSF